MCLTYLYLSPWSVELCAVGGQKPLTSTEGAISVPTIITRGHSAVLWVTPVSMSNEKHGHFTLLSGVWGLNSQQGHPPSHRGPQAALPLMFYWIKNISIKMNVHGAGEMTYCLPRKCEDSSLDSQYLHNPGMAVLTGNSNDCRIEKDRSLAPPGRSVETR